VKALIGIHHAKQGLPWLADLVLVGALAWLVAGWLRHPVAPSPSPARLSAPSPGAAVDIATLAAMPLFGQAEKKAAPKPMPVVPSTLNLKLVGTAVTDHGSVAIVQGAGNKQKVAMVGDALMPGVVLKRISTDAIEVAHQGRLERINLPKSTLTQATAGNAIPVPVPRAAAVGPAVTGMSGMMRQARLVPHFDRGEVDGILVAGVQPGSVFAAVGLRSGDVIRSLDKKPIHTPQRITGLYRALIEARPVDIGLERGGKRLQLHYKPEAP
jgi:general secretion pathway protein C